MKYAVEVRPRIQPSQALPEAGMAVAAAACVFVIVFLRGLPPDGGSASVTNGTAPDGQHARISVPGAWPAPVTLAVRPPDQDEATVIPPDAPVQCRKIRQGNQAEITDQPGAVQFVEIAGLDVPVGDAGVRLQARQGIRDRGHGFDDVRERPAREGPGNRGSDGHGQPRPICLDRLVRRVRIEQREQSGRALVLSQEADLADESLGASRSKWSCLPSHLSSRL